MGTVSENFDYKEEWRQIRNYEGVYEVSSFGRIRSVGRAMVIPFKDGRIAHRFVRGKIIKPLVGKSNPYQYVCLSRVGQKMKRVRVHKLVAEAFLPNPSGFKVINHKDENPINNEVSNLEWCTVAYNNSYKGLRQRALATRMMRYPKGTEMSYAAKAIQTRNRRNRKSAEIAVKQYSLDGELIQTFRSAVHAGKSLGIWAQNIRNCLYGKYKTSGGYIWERA